jgi:hypothetical protein
MSLEGKKKKQTKTKQTNACTMPHSRHFPAFQRFDRGYYQKISRRKEGKKPS